MEGIIEVSDGGGGLGCLCARGNVYVCHGVCAHVAIGYVYVYVCTLKGDGSGER